MYLHGLRAWRPMKRPTRRMAVWLKAKVRVCELGSGLVSTPALSETQSVELRCADRTCWKTKASLWTTRSSSASCQTWRKACTTCTRQSFCCTGILRVPTASSTVAGLWRSTNANLVWFDDFFSLCNFVFRADPGTCERGRAVPPFPSSPLLLCFSLYLPSPLLRSRTP